MFLCGRDQENEGKEEKVIVGPSFEPKSFHIPSMGPYANQGGLVMESQCLILWPFNEGFYCDVSMSYPMFT